MLASKAGTSLFSCSALTALAQLPLPGIVIFVHGVNSNGEWFDEAERGLCDGLNARLARRDDQLKHCGVEAGQLSPAHYMAEIDADGFLNPDRTAKTFIQPTANYSPVIRFRYGYKASAEELQQYGNGIYLNEEDYWGGGPFANGCSSLPDLWGKGLSEDLFGWVHVQHFNSTNDRKVYGCPPRPYYVLAALRLARLIESIRRQQADVPITIVCHSQGNMVAIAAAFLGDQFPEAKDAAGRSGRCVADSYVLCNPPLSLAESNGTEGWGQREMKDPNGRTGRQTMKARTKTLAAFFEIIRRQASTQQPAERIDRRMANEAHRFNAALDRSRHGVGGSTYGRVTLYCNPHDQVISATPIQGMGWRGMSGAEITATNGDGVFAQRVFSQGFAVGASTPRQYDYWADQYNRPQRGSQDFWVPRSPKAEFLIGKGMEANEYIVGKIGTLFTGAVLKPVLALANLHINALPPDDWKIPLDAPPLPEPFQPQSMSFGIASTQFDQGTDAPGASRDPQRQREPGDPYADIHVSEIDGHTDAPQGNRDTEASLRYEHHAEMRMQSKREHLHANSDKVTEETREGEASDSYKAWRNERIKTSLAENIDTHATDHSTILTNGMHAEMALAYDVAVGCCEIGPEELTDLRVVADWRLLDGLDRNDPNKRFSEYFVTGKFAKLSTDVWANDPGGEGSMPKRIADEREYSPQLDRDSTTWSR